MSNLSFAMIVLAVLSTAAGLPCCFGCLTYIAVPISMVTVAVGLLGLATDKVPATGEIRDARLHSAAVVVGVLCAALGTLRWLAGGACGI